MFMTLVIVGRKTSRFAYSSFVGMGSRYDLGAVFCSFFLSLFLSFSCFLACLLSFFLSSLENRSDVFMFPLRRRPFNKLSSRLNSNTHRLYVNECTRDIFNLNCGCFGKVLCTHRYSPLSTEYRRGGWRVGRGGGTLKEPRITNDQLPTNAFGINRKFVDCSVSGIAIT